MHLIVTRPKADADKLKSRLEANGHAATVVPLLAIRNDDKITLPDTNWQAIAVTSANALTALNSLGIPKQLKTVPLYAVGPASAGLAGDLGFADVRQAAGDMVALRDLMQQELQPDGAPVLYLTGKVRSGDLAAELGADGFTVERIELYEAIATAQLPARAIKMIRAGSADGVLLYSVRTADTWLQLVNKSDVQADAARLTHFCLSPAVAEKVRSGFSGNVSIVISGNPDDDSMLEAVEEAAATQPNDTATRGKGATMANRKKPARKARKPARPTVIDAKATEVKPDEAGKQPCAPAAGSGAAAGKPENGKTTDNTRPADQSGGTGTDQKTQASKGKPQSKGPATPAKKPSGKGKLITGALVVTLLAGVAGGGYLYREYGTRLFGSTEPAIDVGAIEGQALEAIGTAKSASEAADSALAQSKSLSEKIAGLEQQLADTRTSTAAPDPDTMASIKAASDLASSARSEIAAISAKTGEIETGMADIRKSVADLKAALQAAASSGGGAEQAEVNLKFEELAQRIAKLEAAPAQPADDKLAGEVSTLRDQLSAASERLEKLEAQLATALAAPRPDAAVSAQQPAVDTAAIAAQLAVLSDTVNQGKPYQAQLTALEETASLTLNLPALSANAGTGIKPLAGLKQDLAGLKSGLEATGQPEDPAAEASSGWWSTLTGKLSSVVKVRKIDGAGNWPEQVTSALAALDTGGLAAAIAALDAGGPSAPEPVKAWIVEARKRLTADQELQKLPQIILGRLPAPAQ